MQGVVFLGGAHAGMKPKGKKGAQTMGFDDCGNGRDDRKLMPAYPPEFINCLAELFHGFNVLQEADGYDQVEAVIRKRQRGCVRL